MQPVAFVKRKTRACNRSRTEFFTYRELQDIIASRTSLIKPNCNAMDDKIKDNRQLAKILYIIPEGEEDEGSAESLWAYSLGEQLYELQNIPIYTENLNIGDVVRCHESAEELPVIDKLAQKSGNRTLRVIFREEASAEDAVDLVIMPLAEKGIDYEKAVQRHYMFNVPVNADYNWAINLLRQKDKEGLLWLYEQNEDN